MNESSNSIIGGPFINVPAVMPLDKGEDFHTARRNLHDVINMGMDAFSDAVNIAKSVQSPESFDSVTKMLKALSDANRALLDLQATQKHLDANNAAPQTVNNNLIVGSTEDILKAITKKS